MVVGASSSLQNGSSSYPFWLKQQINGGSPSLAARTEQQRGGVAQYGHSYNHVPQLASMLLQGDTHLGHQNELDNQVAGYGIGTMATNGLHLSGSTLQGPTSQQQISQEVLNLYDLLTRISRTQGQQARSRFQPLPEEHVGFHQGNDANAGITGCPQPLPFDQQLGITYNGQADLNRGVDTRGPNDPMLSFINQSQDSTFLPMTGQAQAPQFANESANLTQSGGVSLSRYDAYLPNLQHGGMVEHQQFLSGSPGQLPAESVLQNLPKPLPKHPLRALSAYNFFFREERDRIVNETEGEYDISADKKRELLERHWYRDRTTKRRHRKTHGKIAFTELSKVISQRWKGLSEHVKAFYHDVAAEDSLRYNREVDAQKSLQY